jgi:carboxymethylenebutenolidase
MRSGPPEETVSGTITFTRPDGKPCTGFYAEPARGAGRTGDAGAGTSGGANAPGVVVIQEWWGLNDQIRGVATRLSDAGYRVIVPDLYRGKLGLAAKEAEHLMTGLDFADAASQDIRGAVQHVKTSSAKVGVTGFCMGGALTILSAVFVPESDAAVCWYGLPPLDYVDPSKIKAPLMGHFATQDAHFPIAQADALDEKLSKANVPHEFFRYDAQHAFAHEKPEDPAIATRYDAACADLAWTRTMAFLAKHLS